MFLDSKPQDGRLFGRARKYDIQVIQVMPGHVQI